MYKIALIGAGQLGSRHLQGLAKSKHEVMIEVVEPFQIAQETAQKRFNEVCENNNVKEIKFYKNIYELSDELDLVIVATNSDIRYKVVSELLGNKKVINLVLEKVLFQKLEDYEKIDKLLNDTNTKCWVNHPRRMFPFYNKLKEKLSNSKNIHFSVSGGNWGLGCNGLHFLDCFEYLSNGASVKQIDAKYLNKKLYNTKREGFKELNGMITGKIDDYTFSINCFEEDLTPMQLNITSEKLNICINESHGLYIVLEKENDWKIENKEEKIIYFQSELTNILIEDIFNNNCSLPSFTTAKILHIKYLEAIISHINSFNEIKYEFCPIT